MKHAVLFSFFALLGLILLSSCGFLEEKFKLRPFKIETINSTSGTGQRKSPVKTAAARKQAFDRKTVFLHLEHGEFIEALLVMRRNIKRGVPEKDMAAEYLPCLNGAIAKAQSLLAENDPGPAGSLFHAVLDGYPKDPALAAGVSLRPIEIEAALKICADQLMEKGIVAYRSGNLGQAIDIWKEALVFCPRHQNCQKAIQTTNAQLGNLEKITTDK